MLRSGLIGAWLVNEGGGSSLENALRETRDPITGATWAPGLDGPSLNFTGGATDHVDLGALNPGAAGATASLWFKIPAGNTTGGGLLSQYDNTTSGSSFMLWQRGGFNVFDIYSSGVAGSQSVNMAGAAINDGKWHHLLAVWDNALGLFRVYIDGAKQTIGGYNAPFTTQTTMTRLGAPAAGFNSAQFQTQNVALWNRPLSDAEALQLYAQPYALYVGPRSPADTGAAGTAASGPQSVPLTVAIATWTAPALTPHATITRALTIATATWTAPTVTPHATVSRPLTIATASWTVPTIAPHPTVTRPLTVATATWTANGIAVGGSQTVPLTVGTATWVVPTITPHATITRALTVATASWTVPTVTPHATIARPLTVAVATWTARNVNVITGSALTAAVATWTVPTIVAHPGPVSRPLTIATASWQVPTIAPHPTVTRPLTIATATWTANPTSVHASIVRPLTPASATWSAFNVGVVAHVSRPTTVAVATWHANNVRVQGAKLVRLVALTTQGVSTIALQTSGVPTIDLKTGGY
jgi:hypothetical protein